MKLTALALEEIIEESFKLYKLYKVEKISSAKYKKKMDSIIKTYKSCK